MPGLIAERGPKERTEHQWSAVVVQPDGSDGEAVTLDWIEEKDPFKRRDGTRGMFKALWPVGYHQNPYRVGHEHESSACIWRSETDQKVVVQLDLGGCFDTFVAPGIRQGLAIVREWLPVMDHEKRHEVLEVVAEHLFGCCERRGCNICRFLEGAGS